MAGYHPNSSQDSTAKYYGESDGNISDLYKRDEAESSNSDQSSSESESDSNQSFPDPKSDSDQSSSQSESDNDQPSPEPICYNDQSSPEPICYNDQPSPEPICYNDQPSPEPKGDNNQPSPDPKSDNDQSSSESESDSDQSSSESESDSDQSSSESESDNDQSSPEPICYNDQPSPEPKGDNNQPSPDPKSDNDQSSSESESETSRSEDSSDLEALSVPSDNDRSRRFLIQRGYKRKFGELEQDAYTDAAVSGVQESVQSSLSTLSDSCESLPQSPSSYGSVTLNCNSGDDSQSETEISSASGSENENDCQNDPLFDGSGLSAEEFHALTLAFFKKHHLSEAAKEDFLKLIDISLPEENKVAKSAYSFNKRHSDLKLQYMFRELCPSCNNVVKSGVCENNICELFDQSITPVTFFVLPLKPQIQRIVTESWKEIEEYRTEMEEETDCLRDIPCGKVYKSFLQGPFARGKKIFSIVVSCDGAPVLKSRSLNMWPLMCFLVELPPQLRYKLKNVLLAGLWYGKNKPDMSVFLDTFVDELKEMSRECEFEDNNGQPVVSLVRIQKVVPDLPAMAILLNMKQYNGNFGCSVCKHPGSYSHEYKTRIYEYMDDLPMRTAEESKRLSDIAESNCTTIFGIKGKNAFGELISIPDNVQIDWMHCVCEGVLKRQLFDRWFSSEYVNEGYSLLTVIDELDGIFLSVKVPHDLSRKPRSFNDKKHWKASEFRFFLLFSGLPCLRKAVILGNLSPDIFYHFALLVTAMRHLHSGSATGLSVDIAQLLLNNFVRLFPVFYGSSRVCTYNNHALRHMPKQVLDNGPLSFTSAFVFESFIAHLKRLFSGTRGIPRQMVDRLGVSQNYKAHVMNTCKGDTKVENLSKRLISDTSNFTNCEDDIGLFAPIVRRKLPREFCTALNSYLYEGQVSDVSEFQVSFRMKKDHTTYHSLMYLRKGNSCSYIVQYISERGRFEYGQVICFILFESVAYALLYNYKMTGCNVCQGIEAPKDLVMKGFVDNNLIGKQFQEVEESSSTPVVIKCKRITNRCLFIPFGDGKKGFLTFLDTTFEHD